MVTNLLNDFTAQQYFRDNNSEVTSFDHYYKGCHELGSVVESCVKMTRRLLSGSFGKNVLEIREFEFVVAHCNHLVNRRPVAFKESLRDCNVNSVPQQITPEMLIHGRELISANMIPALEPIPQDEYNPGNSDEFVTDVRDSYCKLRTVREKLVELYNNEFVVHLIHQATNDAQRYTPVSHDNLDIGDLVLIKEDNCKPANYPMGRIQSVLKNDLGELTGAKILKGSTREVVKRHASVLIPLLKMSECNSSSFPQDEPTVAAAPVHAALEYRNSRPLRAAAVNSSRRTREMLQL